MFSYPIYCQIKNYTFKGKLLVSPRTNKLKDTNARMSSEKNYMVINIKLWL